MLSRLRSPHPWHGEQLGRPFCCRALQRKSRQASKQVSERPFPTAKLTTPSRPNSKTRTRSGPKQQQILPQPTNTTPLSVEIATESLCFSNKTKTGCNSKTNKATLPAKHESSLAAFSGFLVYNMYPYFAGCKQCCLLVLRTLAFQRFSSSGFVC